SEEVGGVRHDLRRSARRGAGSAHGPAPRAASGRVLAGDVVLKLVDGRLLIGNDPLHEVADGEDTYHLVALEHRQVSHPLLGHEGEALVDRVGGRHRDDRAAHDLSHPRLPGKPPFKDDLARVVALGNHPHEPLLLHHYERAHALFGHLLDGLVDGGTRGQKPDRRPLLREHARNRVNHDRGPQRRVRARLLIISCQGPPNRKSLASASLPVRTPWTDTRSSVAERLRDKLPAQSPRPCWAASRRSGGRDGPRRSVIGRRRCMALPLSGGRRSTTTGVATGYWAAPAVLVRTFSTCRWSRPTTDAPSGAPRSIGRRPSRSPNANECCGRKRPPR